VLECIGGKLQAVDKTLHFHSYTEPSDSHAHVTFCSTLIFLYAWKKVKLCSVRIYTTHMQLEWRKWKQLD